MNRRPLSLSLAALALVVAGGLFWLREAHTEAPMRASVPVSPTAAPVAAHVPSETAAPEQVSLSSQPVLAIERALVAGDGAQRETAFNVVLPELLAHDPNAVVAMLDRQPPGEPRDALREEIARRWIRQDRVAATEWLHSLEDGAERRAAATVAMHALAAGSVPEAVELADQFGIGRSDGSVEHMLQIWALSNPEQAHPEQAHPDQKTPTRDATVSN